MQAHPLKKYEKMKKSVQLFKTLELEATEQLQKVYW